MRSLSNFARKPRDAYDTIDARAIPPLLPFLPRHVKYAEPCAGRGALIALLTDSPKAPVCTLASDIEPRNPVEGDSDPARIFIRRGDALALTREDLRGADLIITNPPWSRPELHRLIGHLSTLAPTWILLDAGWVFTKQAGPFLPLLRKIVTVPRLKWEEGSAHNASEDCVWLLFAAPRHYSGPAGTQFYGRRT